MSSTTRTIVVPADTVGYPDALLTITVADNQTTDRESALFSLLIDHRLVASTTLNSAIGQDWSLRSNAEVCSTFESFLSHALDSDEPDAQDGWVLVFDGMHDAGDYVSSLCDLAIPEAC